MKILGIDQSYNSCAWVIAEGASVSKFGVFKSDKTQGVYDRSLFIAQSISQLVKDQSITHLNIEGLAFAMRGDSTRDLAGLLFSIMIILKIDHPTLYRREIAPTSLKKFATGSGKSDKNQMIEALPVDIKQQFVDSGYKKTTGLTDLTDAYWLSQYTL